MPTFGQLLFTRRQNQGMTLSGLSKEMGGSPSESFLWRVEADESSPTPTMAIKLARGVHLPEELVLNAAGHATPKQQQAAFAKLADLIGELAPIPVSYNVLDPDTGEPTRERVTHFMRAREEGFAIRLSGQPDSMFDGECVVSTSRKPAEGQGVIILRNGRLSAATYHNAPPVGEWIQRGEEKFTKGYEIKGAILRVIYEKSWE
jgi:transcriptional regulator with XRE-family HTH domain